jgi:hypothetical protein
MSRTCFKRTSPATCRAESISQYSIYFCATFGGIYGLVLIVAARAENNSSAQNTAIAVGCKNRFFEGLVCAFNILLIQFSMDVILRMSGQITHKF